MWVTISQNDDLQRLQASYAMLRQPKYWLGRGNNHGKNVDESSYPGAATGANTESHVKRLLRVVTCPVWQ